MKAAVLKAFGAPLSIEEVDDPRPGPDDAVIAVKVCGIDGTDLKLLDGFGYTPELPFIMGHEVAGVVESVGDARDGLRAGRPRRRLQFPDPAREPLVRSRPRAALPRHARRRSA